MSKPNCDSCGERTGSTPFQCKLCCKCLHPQKCAKPVAGFVGTKSVTICGQCATNDRPPNWSTQMVPLTSPGTLAITAPSTSLLKPSILSSPVDETDSGRGQTSSNPSRNFKRKAADDCLDVNSKKAKALKEYDLLDDAAKMRAMYASVIGNELAISNNSELIKSIRIDLENSSSATNKEMTRLANNQKSLESRIQQLESSSRAVSSSTQFDSGLSISGLSAVDNEDLLAKCLALFASLDREILKEQVVNVPRDPGHH